MKKYFGNLVFVIIQTAILANGISSYAQKIRYNEIKGVYKSKILDEYDNSIIFSDSKFLPFKLHLRFADEKWIHQLSFYYIKNTLTPIDESNGFVYNTISNESGELHYDILRRIYQSGGLKLSVFTGIGIYAFGGFRDRKSLSRLYPYEDNVTAYDVNAGSLQLIINPNFTSKGHHVSLLISSGILNLLTRPNSYNPRFNSNDGKWPLVSMNKHVNLFTSLEYKFDLSKSFSAGFEYRYFYYKYSFPYTLRVLTQHYLLGLAFKF